MTTNQVLLAVGLILVLAVGSQVLASRLRMPAIIVLLPAGFTASLSYTATDTILNLIASLAGPSAIGTGGLSVNQRNVATALDTFFNTGGRCLPALSACSVSPAAISAMP